MPLTTEITEDCMGIVHLGSGLVTGDEIVAASKAALRLVQTTTNFQYEFVDFSAATGLEAKEEHLQQITALDRVAAVLRPHAVVVIVAQSDDFYRLGLDWEARIRHLGWTTHITHDRAEAVEWLSNNFPPPSPAKLAADIDAASPVIPPAAGAQVQAVSR